MCRPRFAIRHIRAKIKVLNISIKGITSNDSCRRIRLKKRYPLWMRIRVRVNVRFQTSGLILQIIVFVMKFPTRQYTRIPFVIRKCTKTRLNSTSPLGRVSHRQITRLFQVTRIRVTSSGPLVNSCVDLINGNIKARLRKMFRVTNVNVFRNLMLIIKMLRGETNLGGVTDAPFCTWSISRTL